MNKQIEDDPFAELYAELIRMGLGVKPILQAHVRYVSASGVVRTNEQTIGEREANE